MCGAAAVLVFDEPATVWLLVGTGLTLAGLVVLGIGRRRAASIDNAETAEGA